MYAKERPRFLGAVKDGTAGGGGMGGPPGGPLRHKKISALKAMKTASRTGKWERIYKNIMKTVSRTRKAWRERVVKATYRSVLGYVFQPRHELGHEARLKAAPPEIG
jgi:hypothetical protein